MNGNPEVVAALNGLLADELAAVNQYMMHAEMCANWGYAGLHDEIHRRAVSEMRHAEKLIARIILLEGTPKVEAIGPVLVGGDVREQFENDAAAELRAIESYNAAIRLAAERGDNGTRALLDGILSEEESHHERIDALSTQIIQIGLTGFLTAQARVGGADGRT